MLGYRGAHRSLKELDVLRSELAAIRELRDTANISHLHLLLPFVRTVDEYNSVRQLIIHAGLRPGRDLKLGLVAQTPASLLMAEELIAHDFLQAVCLDLDSLGQLLLGFDMHNPRLQGEYSLSDAGVLKFIGQAIHQFRAAGIPVTVSGKVLHDRPELIEWFVQVGVTGFVLEPDLLAQSRRLVASAEQRLLLDHAIS
jgi:pyruvate,water dikinase